MKDEVAVEKAGPQENPAVHRQRLSGNVKTITRWQEAIKGGNYQGHRAKDVAGLLDFLQYELDTTRKLLDKALDEAAGKVPTPAWGTPATEPMKGITPADCCNRNSKNETHAPGCANAPEPTPAGSL